MPVVFNGINSTASGALAVTLQFNLTAAAGDILLVYASNSQARSVSAVAYNSVALTRLTGVANVTNNLEIWALTAPNAGTLTLSANFVRSADWILTGMTYSNVKAVGPFGTVAIGSAAAGLTANQSASSTTTDLVVFNFIAASGGMPVFNNGTSRLSKSNGATNCMIAMDIAGAPSITASATDAAAVVWLMTGVPLVFSAAAAGAALRFQMLTGCGR